MIAMIEDGSDQGQRGQKLPTTRSVGVTSGCTHACSTDDEVQPPKEKKRKYISKISVKNHGVHSPSE
jgi:hypothetical protein